jgi:hypothetical protein
MKIRIIITATMLTVLAAAVWAGEVSQGRLIASNQSPAVFTIEEYDPNFSEANPYGTPTGIISQYDVSTAKIGIRPEPGDVLRIVYEEIGNTRRAIKVMNVTKQDLRKD